MHTQSLQLCPTLCNPMNYSPPGSSVHGILQARVLEWVAMKPSFSGSSQSRDRIWVSHIAGRFFTIWATRERQMVMSKSERVVTKEKIRLTVAVSAELFFFFFFSFNGPSRWINTYLHFLTLSSWDRGYHPHHFVERRREVGQSVQNHTVTKRNRVSVWTQVIRLQNFCSLLQGAA